jgi:hypothetical protein
MEVIREEISIYLFFLIRALPNGYQIVNGLCKLLDIRLLVFVGVRISWWINVSWIVGVLNRLFMGGPMNNNSQQWMKGSGFRVRSNSNQTSGVV